MPVNLTDNEEVMQRVVGPLGRRLFVVAGPSGVGKNTIIKELLATHPEIGRIRTYTTRPSRGEYENRQYHFVTQNEFDQLAHEGELLEFKGQDVYGDGELYSMPTDLFKDISPEQHIVIAEVDVAGTQLLLEKFDDVVTIFVVAPPLELMRRIANRHDEAMDADKIRKRLETARAQIKAAAEFDYIVFNREDHFCQTMREIEAIIMAERLRVKPGLDLTSDADHAFELVNEQLAQNENGPRE